MLFVVRHGQTAANARGLLLGRANPPLTDLGRAQAAALAAALPAPALVVASPLLRARDTATAFGRPVRVDERWIELDYGEWDEEPVHDVPDEQWRQWRDDVDFVPPGGESLAALATRVHGACDDLAGAAAESDVVVVTHVSPVKAAVAWTLGVSPGIAWRTYVEDAAVCRIAIGDHGPVLRSFNERHGP
ncbi:MAG: histidine phosphatase family protein, partial [Euzebyales bacterium]|nr:histidine phosphatase family protein [Euzebyales bacterium]